MVGELRTVSRRPGESAAAKPSRIESDIERHLPHRPRRTPRLPRARRPRCAPDARRAAAGIAPRTSHRGHAGQQLTAERDRPALDAELDPLAGDRRAELGGCFSSTVAASSDWRPKTATPSGRRMPAFSAPLRPPCRRARRWSSEMGVTTSTTLSMTFVASQLPPMPDFDDTDLDRRVGKGAERHRRQHFEERHAFRGPARRRARRRARHRRRRARKLWAAGRPSRLIRSVTDSRWGEV